MDNLVAVFGGTFNPVHNGHVEMANAVCALPYVEKLVIIPTYKPPHKTSNDLASGEHRMNMCRLAFAELEKAEVSDIEQKRGGSSYTYDTLMELKKTYNSLALVCGGDMITSFSSWYRSKDILKMATLIAFRRVGVDNSQFDLSVNNLEKNGGKVIVLDADILDISSSQIRNGDFLEVPTVVFDYIKQNGIYGVK